MKKVILYLRTDIADQELTAGGSVAHTLGVMQGFCDEGFSIVCASSCLDSVLKQVPLEKVIKLANPAWLKPLRWKLNSFFSTFFFFFQARSLCKEYSLAAIYQRYSLLNMTGLLLAWWYNKKFILEYNGSEAWIASRWIKNKKYMQGVWFLYVIEKINTKYADYIVVVSQVLKDELVVKGTREDKILVNPNGVNVLVFNPESIQKSYYYE